MNISNPFEAIIEKLDYLQTTVNNLVFSNEPIQSNESQRNNLHDFINLSEASQLLHMPESTIHFHKKCNNLPYLKPGKRLLFKRQDLLNWLENYNSKEKEGGMASMLQNRMRYAKK